VFTFTGLANLAADPRGGIAVREIAEWLKKLGMSEYAKCFAENRIDFSVLPELTDQHLKDLGLPLGDRLKMLRAIPELSSPVSPPPPQPEQRSQATAERRQVTVMFSDLVGSTALSTRMDPEDLREVISAYQKCVAETVQRFGGFVAKYMGDGVLVYFGYPQAHEDDAERAVRAGLEMTMAVTNLKTHAALQTRVGIATGLVVVGDLIGSGASQEQAIVGETPNLAARLQGIAEPNSVVIAESTRKLVGNLFELEDLVAKTLKGVEGPVRAWAAQRPSSVESRFEALHASGVRNRPAAAALAMQAVASSPPPAHYRGRSPNDSNARLCPARPPLRPGFFVTGGLSPRRVILAAAGTGQSQGRGQVQGPPGGCRAQRWHRPHDRRWSVVEQHSGRYGLQPRDHC
jgi:class 3 adenylate cyclase